MFSDCHYFHFKWWRPFVVRGRRRKQLTLSVVSVIYRTFSLLVISQNFYKKLQHRSKEIQADLLIFRILISNNIFSNSIRPPYDTFRAIHHLPQQFFLSGANQQWIWPYRAANESYKMRFNVGSSTIMIKRNKKNSRCIESYENYDDWVLKLYKNEAKCNIPYQKQDNLLPMCTSKERKKRALLSYDIVDRQHMDRPCRTMEGIDVKHLESPMATPKGEHVGHFWFSVMFQQRTLTEIEQKR